MSTPTRRSSSSPVSNHPPLETKQSESHPPVTTVKGHKGGSSNFLKKVGLVALVIIGAGAGVPAAGVLFSFTAVPFILGALAGAAVICGLIGLALLCKAIANKLFGQKAKQPIQDSAETTKKSEDFKRQLRELAEGTPIPGKQLITDEDIDSAFVIVDTLLRSNEKFKNFGNQGVSRLSADPKELAAVKKQLEDGEYDSLLKKDCIHELMGILKAHYKKMNLLGGPELAKEFIRIGEMPDDEKAEAVQQMQQLAQKLDNREYFTLLGFVDIYHKILIAQRESELEDNKKMGLNALAIMASPNLLSLTGPQEGAYRDALIKASELLIENFEQIFQIK